MIALRRIFMCWWGGCGGHVDHDDVSVHWKCKFCGRVHR